MLEYLRSPPHASVGWLTASGLRGGIYFFWFAYRSLLALATVLIFVGSARGELNEKPDKNLRQNVHKMRIPTCVSFNPRLDFDLLKLIIS